MAAPRLDVVLGLTRAQQDDDRPAAALNRQVLAALGAAPDSVARLPDNDWAAVRELRTKAAALLRARLERGVARLRLDELGAARLLRFWQAVFAELGVETRYEIGWRAPAAAAAALQAELCISAERAQLLWLVHYVDALRDTRGKPCRMVEEKAGSASVSEPDGLVARCAELLRAPVESEIQRLDDALAAMAPLLDEMDARGREVADLQVHLGRARGELGATAGQLEQARREAGRLRVGLAETDQARQAALAEAERRHQAALAEREARLAELQRERATFGAAVGRALTRWHARLAPAGTLRDRAFAGLVRLLRRWRRAPAAKALDPDPGGRYAAFRRQRLAARASAYPDYREPGLLSFLTTVWNTPPEYLDGLAAALAPQLREGGHEWVVLDNGCTERGTLDSLKRLARAPGVRLERVERNVGIIPGMRRCLEAARGRYVLPVDSDDWLTPDAARIVASFLHASGFPAAAYTDEDKLDGKAFVHPYFKPAWDPVLFVNSCYIAHLCAFQREEALKLGVYTNPQAEGAHDWDTYLRFYLAGHTPAHLPEVTYSWRMHPQSTAMRVDSKDYILASHRAVLGGFLERRGKPGRFRLEASPMFGDEPHNWMRRGRVEPRPVLTALFGAATREPRADFPASYPGHRALRVDSTSAGALREAAHLARDSGALLHLMWEKVRLVGDEWPWEAQGLMELFPDCAMVGGRVLGGDGRVRAAGYYFGFGGGVDCPDRGRDPADPGYFYQLWKPHSVSAVSAQHAVVDPAFLLECLDQPGFGALSTASLGAWLGAAARRRQRRVIYTPFLEGRCDEDFDALASAAERQAFVRASADLVPDTELLSPRLAHRPPAYQPASDDARREHLARLGMA